VGELIKTTHGCQPPDTPHGVGTVWACHCERRWRLRHRSPAALRWALTTDELSSVSVPVADHSAPLAGEAASERRGETYDPPPGRGTVQPVPGWADHAARWEHVPVPGYPAAEVWIAREGLGRRSALAAVRRWALAES
jgi:hypothetical protein